ncbi:hypothetical protein B0J11DRAFT_155527 [Dendryphion nanum]|uniref:Uncharacterized protein n=1 Tax=Dendryphion nanum TaxID=256645 RepID=A0A9P9EET3_9PLEO|nr:hypothetical protein B0J11DRAFT_155527 [Dendryphion nanum]
MLNSLLTPALLILSLFHTTVLAGIEQDIAGPLLVPRQQAVFNNAPECLDYARIANLSTVGTNSTLRSAYLQSSSTGTLYDKRMFTDAQLKLPALTANATLNAQCQNWTAIALVESDRNYSQRVVLQFNNVLEQPQAIKAGPELLAILAFIFFIFFGVWCFMP